MQRTRTKRQRERCCRLTIRPSRAVACVFDRAPDAVRACRAFRACGPVAAFSASSTAFASAGTEPVAPASPAPLAPSTLAGDGTPQSISVIGERIVCPRHEVIHEGAGQELAGVRVVDDVLAEHLADALHQAAVQLALDQLVIDDVAAVVGRDVVDDAPIARSRGRSRPRRYGRRSETQSQDRWSCWCRADGQAVPTSVRSAPAW